MTFDVGNNHKIWIMLLWPYDGSHMKKGFWQLYEESIWSHFKGEISIFPFKETSTTHNRQIRVGSLIFEFARNKETYAAIYTVMSIKVAPFSKHTILQRFTFPNHFGIYFCGKNVNEFFFWVFSYEDTCSTTFTVIYHAYWWIF